MITIADTLSLSSVAAGRYGDISEDISTLESKYGEMEQPEGMFRKLLQSAKIGFGVGEYQFGEETIAAKDFATTAAKLNYQSIEDKEFKDDYLKKLKMIIDSHCHLTYEPMSLNLKDTIDKMMSHCRKGSVIMFRSDYQTELSDGSISYNAGEILSWVISKYNLAALDHSAGDGQCYLVIYKTLKSKKCFLD